MALSDLRPADVDRLNHAALMRLTLRMMGETHQQLQPFQAWLVGLVRGNTNGEGFVNGHALMGAMGQVESRYRAFVQSWSALLTAAREQAASLPFAALVVQHNHFMTGVMQPLTEEQTADEVGTIVNLWQQRRQRALMAAQQRVYGDGLQLSQRIWQLENGGLTDIRNTLATAYAERTSAADLADRLEGLLGAEQDLPRWTNQRLYGMTPSERAVDQKGLLRGPEDRGRGLAYKALRLARTELQYANHAVSTELVKHSPWVTGRKVRLSPGHPKVDICDEYAAGGPYPKDQEILPLHPNCVTPGQMVTTDRGDVPIERIKAGDNVLTHKGQYKQVNKAWSSPHDDTVYEFITPCGRFELTGNHPVLLHRGWVNADAVQLGDQVLYALPSISLDLVLREAKDVPAKVTKESIAPSVKVGLTFMPSAIALNRDLDRGQHDVNEVATNLEFSLIADLGTIEFGKHGDLQGAWIGEPVFSLSQQHGHEARIVDEFCPRDFLSNIWTFGRVVLPSEVKVLAGLAHFDAGRNTTGTVIFAPGRFDGFASTTQGDVMQGQEVAQHAIGQAVAPKDFRGFELLGDVDVTQKFSSGALVFGFDQQDMELNAGQAMLLEVGAGDALHTQPANGASNHTDNLLSLSPDVCWGAESGNSGVKGVANPFQALLNYSTVQEIRQRHYTGPVYNMEVEDDHSYTVNGAAVHNCMCYYENVVMGSSQFAQQVKGWLKGENDFLDDYRDWLGTQRPTEPFPWTLSLADSLELWLSQSQGAQAAALRLK